MALTIISNDLSKKQEVLCDNKIIESTARNQVESQLKKFFISKHVAHKVQKLQKWLQLPSSIRNYIKVTILERLETGDTKQNLAASCIAAIACAELPHNQWPELFDILIFNIIHPSSSDQLREASYITIGLVCKDIKVGVIDIHIKSIYEVLMHGLQDEKSSYMMKATVLRALVNVLRWLKPVLEDDSTRCVFMQTICDSSRSVRKPIKTEGLSCLVKIASLYYDLIDEEFGPQLITITIDAIKCEENKIKLKGIQFWVSICMKEKQIQQNAKSNKKSHTRISSFFTRNVMENLVPLLLTALTKQLHIESVTSSCSLVCLIAHDCLSFMATCCEDHIVNYVMDFVKTNITNSDWRHRYAAVSVFGAVFTGPKTTNLKPLFDIIIPHLPELLQDENEELKKSTVSSIKYMCNSLSQIQLRDHHVDILVDLFLQCFKPEISNEVAFVVCKLIRSISVKNSNRQNGSVMLTQHFEILVTKLLEVIVTTKPTKCIVRKYASSTFDFITSNCPKECYENLQNVLNNALNAVFVNECNPIVILPILNVMIKKLQLPDLFDKSDGIMRACLKILNKNVENWEKIGPQTFRTIGIFACRIKERFVKYMNEFGPMLNVGLKNHNKRKMFKAVLRLTRDIVRGIGGQLIPYCDTVMPILIQSFQTESDKKHRNKFREKCLKLYIAILTGLQHDGLSQIRELIDSDVQVLKNHTSDMVAILNRVAADDNSSETCVQVSGDLMKYYSKREEILIHISDELNENSEDPAIREAAAYRLKCALTSQDPEVKMKKREIWLSFSEHGRTCIKKNILKSLSLDVHQSNLVAECVSHISCAELPRGEWIELATFLDANITNIDSSESIKQITLDTITCICSENIEFGTDQLNDSIIRIIFHVLKYEKSYFLKISALNLFVICVNRLRIVFENEPEKQLMLEALCEASEAENSRMNVIALKSLQKVVLSYYKHVRRHLNTDLLKITIKALKSDESEIRVHGIQFFQSVCSEEGKLQLMQLVLPKLSNLLQDSNSSVKDSSTSTLKYLCENFKEVIASQMDLVILVEHLLKALETKSENAVTVCEAISAVVHIAHLKAKENIAEDKSEFGDQPLETYCLSSQFQRIVSKLVNLMMQSEIQESDLARSIQHTLYCIIRESPNDCSEILLKIMDPLVENLRQTVTSEVSASMDECLLLILPTMKCIVHKTCVFTLSCADELMTLILGVLDTSGDKISIEALKLVAQIAKCKKQC
uniref:Importin subunit beta-1/Transportin-1-like TPR repeats domain-containing protein n=1 Tax=Strigamia maritima TaxID=126957 RepID=T1J444_STRMM